MVELWGLLAAVQFPLLRGLQTAVAISVCVLLMLCGNAIVRAFGDRRTTAGFGMAVAIGMLALALAPSFSWLAVQYWVYDVETPISSPLILRLWSGFGLLTSVAIFIALVQPHHVNPRHAFLLWSGLMALVVFMAAAAG